MKNFGFILKKIRDSKGLSLSGVSNANISTSQLSRFENGETDITFSKLLSVLEILNVSIEEYMYICRGFHRDNIYELVDRMDECIEQNSTTALKELLINCIELKEETITKNLSIIIVKTKLQEIEGAVYLESEDIEFLTNYLFSVDTWGEFELQLFLNSMSLFNQLGLSILTKEMIRRSDFYKDLPSHRNLIIEMLFNAFSISVERNQIVDASYFRKQIISLLFKETEVYERLIFRLIENCYFYKIDPISKYILEIRKCIGLLKTVGCLNLASRWEQYVDKILGNR